MSRTKIKRDFLFKPMFKRFAPVEGASESLTLLHEELEALFLIDYKGMYQEEAAKSMGISRTTLSRIIKNARLKTTTAILNGKALEITDEKEEFVIAFICNDPKNFKELDIHAKYIIYLRIKDAAIQEIKDEKNPLHNSDLRPATVLPNVLQEQGVNYFISNRSGEGLKSSLLTRGIFVLSQTEISQDILDHILQDL